MHIGRSIAATEASLQLAALPEVTQKPVPRTRPIVTAIDDGISFLNTRFRRRDQRAGVSARYRSRFHAIWLQAFQTIPSPACGPAYVQVGQFCTTTRLTHFWQKVRSLKKPPSIAG